MYCITDFVFILTLFFYPLSLSHFTPLWYEFGPVSSAHLLSLVRCVTLVPRCGFEGSGRTRYADWFVMTLQQRNCSIPAPIPSPCSPQSLPRGPRLLCVFRTCHRSMSPPFPFTSFLSHANSTCLFLTLPYLGS